MKKPGMIAIDGTAASGKSTLAIRLAEKLGYLYFDTGVMYRAVTLVALERQISPEDEQGCSELAEQIQIDVRPPSEVDGRLFDVLIDGHDKTWEIRQPEVDANVSVVSTYPRVRHALTEQQRRIALRGNVVMVGRDIGTVVLPEADLKIYMDASVEERARRRYEECLERGDVLVYEDVLASMRRRDQIDATRELAPLLPAEDAVVINSDSLDADQVLEQVLGMLE